MNFLRKISILTNPHYCCVKRLISAKTAKSPKTTGLFPENFQRKKSKTPHSLYISDPKGARIIANHLFDHVPEGNTLIEVNPGPGMLTDCLLEREDYFDKLLLYEALDHFLPHLEELHSLYPDQVKVKHNDFVNIWKLAFQDKLDSGSRVADNLLDVPKKEFSDDVNVRLFAGVGSYNFFKHLINCLVFQTSFLSYGRCEMYLIVPPPIYIHLTCSNEIGYLIYRATSMLFQIMFEYKFIAKLPKEYFLPRQGEYNLSKSNKLTKVKSIDPNHLYFVKVTPRRNLYELCPLEDMQALWYFVKQNCVSRRNRIIPNLEKWIPGSGPRLIISRNESVKVKQLFDENVADIPKYSVPCTTMTNRDYYPYMNIYTQFGDLSPSQMLTLFCQFRSWPEYKESSFLASLENSLLKMETAAVDSVDGLDMQEEDDSPTDLNEPEQVSDKVK